MLTIGIPRALHYFRYYPLAHSFCQTLGVNVVVSPPTTREMLSTGMSCVVAETCLPIKAFCGHVIWLQDKVDYVFVPSLRCIEAPLYNCVKLFALPDMVRGAIKKAPVLDMGYDMSQGTQAIYKGIFALGQQLGFRRKQILAACESALRTRTIYLRLLRQGIPLPQAIEAACGQQLSTSAEAERKVGQQASPPRSATVGVVGHPYITYDDYLNNNLIPRLTKLGVHLLTADTLGRDDLDMGVRQVIG
ncbi:MAG: acyl-CoA dehydratase activase-related protein, partial [Chloroflexi bacterium]|nr:acyl-CoA dehydratase activase-related protein [Chloroflexota bacterium]